MVYKDHLAPKVSQDEMVKMVTKDLQGLLVLRYQ